MNNSLNFFEEYGRTVMQFNQLELWIIALTSIFEVKNTNTELSGAYKKISELTFGQCLKKIENENLLFSNMLPHLKLANGTRKFLIHKFCGLTTLQSIKGENIESIIEQLRNMRTLYENLSKDIETISELIIQTSNLNIGHFTKNNKALVDIFEKLIKEN